MLVISPTKLGARDIMLYRAPNGVILARGVPPECIVQLRAQTKRARKTETKMRALLGLSSDEAPLESSS